MGSEYLGASSVTVTLSGPGERTSPYEPPLKFTVPRPRR